MIEIKKGKFKKIAVLVDVYRMSLGQNVNVGAITGEPVTKDRIYGLTVASKANANYKGTRKWIGIKWLETAKLQLEAGNLDWLDWVLEEKRLECKMLKRAIDFSVKEDYREAVADGEKLKKYNDYIGIVEGEIELLEGIEFKLLEVTKEHESFEYGGETITVTEGMMNKLKSDIIDEGLGVVINEGDSYGDVFIRTEQSRKDALKVLADQKRDEELALLREQNKELKEEIEAKAESTEDEDDLSDLKAIIKEENLNLNVGKKDTRESVLGRMEEARKSK
jgi:hypothetical protein